MGNCRNSNYDKYKVKKNNNEVVKMVTMPLTKVAPTKTAESKYIKNPNKKKSAIEISNSIGVHGAFGRTLSDLHKQGR
ncbi:hypothetical protein ACWE42_21320 [Sutcliffiella cohnii]